MWSYRGNHTNHLDVYHLIHFSSPHGLFLRLSEREKAELVFPNTRRYRREANSSGTWPLPGLWINLGRGPCSFQKQNRLYHLFFGDPACFFIISCYDMTLRTGLTRRNRIAISGVVSGQSSSKVMGIFLALSGSAGSALLNCRLTTLRSAPRVYNVEHLQQMYSV